MNTELATGRLGPALHEVQSKYNVNWQDTKDVIFAPLWDRQSYPAAGAKVLNFFAVQQGQSGKTASDTNMTLAGQLPQPQVFLATGIYVDFVPGGKYIVGAQATAADIQSNASDVQAVYYSGNLAFSIGTKDYAVGAPLALFPPPYHFHLEAALSDATTAAANELTVAANGYIGGDVFVISPIEIPAGQNFSVSLNWPEGAVAPPSGTAGTIGVGILGYLFRPVQ